MKTTPTQIRFPTYCAIVGLVALTVTVLAQSYSVDWFTVDSGGGTSTGGVYAVSGTIGQPEAGPPMTNGQYSVVGGFWSVLAIQSPGAPQLSLARTSTNTIVLWWPLPDTGWQLQSSTNLNQGNTGWTTRPPPYATNATSSYFVEPVPRGNQFYRLHRP